MTDHLGYKKHAPNGRNRGNSRNGKNAKTLKDGKADLPVEIPRDREGSSDPKRTCKYQIRWLDSVDKIISMYARGMSTWDIQSHVEDLYGVAIPPDLVSRITDTVTDKVLAIQSRPWMRSIRSCSWISCSSRCTITATYGTTRSVYLPWAST